MKPLFARLKKAGILKRGKLQKDFLADLRFSRLLDLLDEISVDTARLEKDSHTSIHAHCASLGLGGGRFECAAPSCRTRRLDELARYAALYSDNVFIHNFLADFSPSFGHPPTEDSSELRADVMTDFELLLRIRPLIESGAITIFTPPANICPYCFANQVFGLESGRRLKRAERKLVRDLLRRMSVEIGPLGDNEYYAEVSGLEEVFGHALLTHIEDPPEPIASESELMKRLASGEAILLAPEVARKLEYHRMLASSIMQSLSFQLSVSDAIGTSFLTHREVDLNILSSVSGNTDLDQRNAITAKHLKAMVPFAESVPISKLLELRRREEDSFLRFRAALDQVLQGVSEQKSLFTEQDARQLYADVIAPEVARLNQKVREATRDLIMKPLASAIGTVAVIAFGVYSGMVPAELRVCENILWRRDGRKGKYGAWRVGRLR